MFNIKQIKLFIMLGIVLLICLWGISTATGNIKKAKNAPVPKPTLNPRITPYQVTPTPSFKLF